MRVYLDLVVLLNFLVDLLLLLAADRLAGFPLRLRRILPAAVLGGIYAGACLLPGFYFLGNTLWRIVSLGLMGTIAFGFHKSGLRRCVLFALLSLALGGVVTGLGTGFGKLLLAALGIGIMCAVGFRGNAGDRTYIPVTLRWEGREESFMALVDTGNTLRDPITGERVLVVSGDVARRLLGLTQAQLSAPVQTLAQRVIPGLRLIPYRSVGQPGGMLLGLRMEHVKLGKEIVRTIVAFAPEGLDREGAYQALTGGAV